MKGEREAMKEKKKKFMRNPFIQRKKINLNGKREARCAFVFQRFFGVGANECECVMGVDGALL